MKINNKDQKYKLNIKLAINYQLQQTVKQNSEAFRQGKFLWFVLWLERQGMVYYQSSPGSESHPPKLYFSKQKLSVFQHLNMSMPSQVANWSRRPKQNTKKEYNATRLSLYPRDAFVTCPDKWYVALEKVFTENKINWSKDLANSIRIAYNVITVSLSEGGFCLLSR